METNNPVCRPHVQVDNSWSEENLLEYFDVSGSSHCI